eukprot:scaffold370_cov349-Pavlova_lutheri.AAC.26
MKLTACCAKHLSRKRSVLRAKIAMLPLQKLFADAQCEGNMQRAAAGNIRSSLPCVHGCLQSFFLKCAKYSTFSLFAPFMGDVMYPWQE